MLNQSATDSVQTSKAFFPQCRHDVQKQLHILRTITQAVARLRHLLRYPASQDYPYQRALIQMANVATNKPMEINDITSRTR